MARPIQDANVPYQLGQAFAIKGGLDGMALDEIIVPVAIVRDLTGGSGSGGDEVTLPPGVSTDPRWAWGRVAINADPARNPASRLINPADRKKVLRVYQLDVTVQGGNNFVYITFIGDATGWTDIVQGAEAFMDRPTPENPVGRIEGGEADIPPANTWIPLTERYCVSLTTETFHLPGLILGPGRGLACYAVDGGAILSASWRWTEEDAPDGWPESDLIPV